MCWLFNSIKGYIIDIKIVIIKMMPTISGSVYIILIARSRRDLIEIPNTMSSSLKGFGHCVQIDRAIRTKTPQQAGAAPGSNSITLLLSLTELKLSLSFSYKLKIFIFLSVSRVFRFCLSSMSLVFDLRLVFRLRLVLRLRPQLRLQLQLHLPEKKNIFLSA